MKGTRIAEWLLCHVTTPARAAAQVGDLLEISQTRGALWFWRAVLGNVVHVGFSFMLAFVPAFTFSQIMAILWNHGDFGNQPDRNSVYTIGMLVLAPLCAVPVFLLLRFGWRDTHARLCLLFAFLAAVSFIAYPHPGIRWTFPAIAILTAAVPLIKGRHRNWIPLQSLAQITSAVAISFGGLLLFFLTLLLLWAVMCWWLNEPRAFFDVTMTLSGHPVNDLINALICLVMVRASERLHGSRIVPQPL